MTLLHVNRNQFSIAVFRDADQVVHSVFHLFSVNRSCDMEIWRCGDPNPIRLCINVIYCLNLFLANLSSIEITFILSRALYIACVNSSEMLIASSSSTMTKSDENTHLNKEIHRRKVTTYSSIPVPISVQGYW